MLLSLLFFFFNDTATTEIYTLSLHDALPIYDARRSKSADGERGRAIPRIHRMCSRHEKLLAPSLGAGSFWVTGHGDRKSTRLNSSHVEISYAVFCLKKKKKKLEK